MTIHDELKSMLKELIPYIKGKWFVADGVFLGLMRDGKMIDWDDDIDIYLHPDAYIDFDSLKNSSLNYQQYYLCGKIYREKNERKKKNPWTEYLAYIRTRDFYNKPCARSTLFSKAKEHYGRDKLLAKYTFPFIDIFKLEKKNDLYKIEKDLWDDLYYTENDLNSLVINNQLGFPIYIPSNYNEILSRQYGDWKTPYKYKWDSH